MSLSSLNTAINYQEVRNRLLKWTENPDLIRNAENPLAHSFIDGG